MENKLKGRELLVIMATELKILNLAFKPLSDEEEEKDPADLDADEKLDGEDDDDEEEEQV